MEPTPTVLLSRAVYRTGLLSITPRDDPQHADRLSRAIRALDRYLATVDG